MTTRDSAVRNFSEIRNYEKRRKERSCVVTCHGRQGGRVRREPPLATWSRAGARVAVPDDSEIRPPARTAGFCSYAASFVGCAAIVALATVALYVTGRNFSC